MIVACGADHAGVVLKRQLVEHLQEKGIATLDLGTNGTESVDYPDFAHQVCDVLGRESDHVGLLVCGTGIGMSIAANRHAHIRCAIATSVEMARLTRQHNDANVLALGARIINDDVAKAILDVFLMTPYEGGRHATRLAKLSPSAPS